MTFQGRKKAPLRLTLRSALTSLPKPVPFHLKFVMLHNDSSFSQILLSNCCQMRSDIMVLDILYLILVCPGLNVILDGSNGLSFLILVAILFVNYLSATLIV